MTQIAKHTPGPWFLDENRRGSHISVHSKDHGDLARIVWQMASDYREGKPSPTCEANAHLVAAAPDLLAFVESITDSLGPYDYLNGKSIVGDAHRLVRKARGEAA